jgi:hypothetical protein
LAAYLQLQLAFLAAQVEIHGLAVFHRGAELAGFAIGLDHEVPRGLVPEPLDVALPGGKTKGSPLQPTKTTRSIVRGRLLDLVILDCLFFGAWPDCSVILVLQR